MSQESDGIGVLFGFPPLQLRIIWLEWAPAQSRQQMSRKAGLVFNGKLICDMNRFNKCLHGSRIANLAPPSTLAISEDGLARDNVEKDWSDVLALIKAHQLSLDDPEFSAAILKHGGETALKRIQAASSGGN